MNHHKAPLFEALVAHASRKPTSFHVPGHKSGTGWGGGSETWFGRLLQLDLTELPGLDDLHQPEGPILAAEQLAADLFGAEESCFLIGGSTVGNLAMITALCSRGDILITQRNVHKSVLHGLMLAGAHAVFLPMGWDQASGMAAGTTAEAIGEALMRYPQAKAVLLTNPNYYGVGVELEPIIAMAHQYGKPVLVDEAHGAHYGLHPALPRSALDCGADAVVQSTHKLLTAMTMGSMLHMQGERINRRLIRQRLALLQSSSPSYPIMASLDLSRREIALQGANAFEQSLAVVALLRAAIHELPWFQCGPPAVRQTGTTNDPYKLLLRETTGRLSGFALKAALEQGGCYAELADPQQVLLVCSPATTQADADRLLQALRQISSSLEQAAAHGSAASCSPENAQAADEQQQITSCSSRPVFDILESVLSEPIRFGLPFEQEHAEVRMIPLADAAGWRSAETIIPYPPGIPVLYPGERMTKPILLQLEVWIRAGGSVQGMKDRELLHVEVRIEQEGMDIDDY